MEPEMKLQMELSVAIANRICEILEATICKISAALDAEVVKVPDNKLEPAFA
jgi:hypothetical protein